ncbi:MAG: UTP--glucose-1-phosphate uridylyltransferase GalU [Pseudomonadota bacterium]
MSRVRTAVFPVAGLGTRMLPATKVLPKEMLPVVDKPIVQYALEEAATAGIETYVFVTGRGKSLIEDHFDRAFELFETLIQKEKHELLNQLEDGLSRPGNIVYTRQQQPKGLGHAVWCARHVVGDDPFAVVLVDDLICGRQSCLSQMVDAYSNVGGNVVALVDVPNEHTSRYGVIEPGEQHGNLVEIKAIVEKPAPEEAPSNFAVVGRYILAPQIMTILEDLAPGAGGEIQLTDAMAAMIGESPFHGLRFDGRRFDCGNKLGYFEAQLALAVDHEEIGGDVRRLIAAYTG